MSIKRQEVGSWAASFIPGYLARYFPWCLASVAIQLSIKRRHTKRQMYRALLLVGATAHLHTNKSVSHVTVCYVSAEGRITQNCMAFPLEQKYKLLHTLMPVYASFGSSTGLYVFMFSLGTVHNT